MARRKRVRGPARRLATWANDRFQPAIQACRRAISHVMRRLHREAAVVLVDGPAARHLRPLIASTSRVFAASLGAALPAGLVIVVQRVVRDGRHLNGSLQVFVSPEGSSRYLLQLAQSVNGRQVSDEELLAAIERQAVANGGSVELTNDVFGAFEETEVVYAKSWGSKDYYGDPNGDIRIRTAFRDKWIVDEAKMGSTTDAIFMHCLPVRRNVIVTDRVIDSTHSVVIDEAENRLHVQKAIISELFK